MKWIEEIKGLETLKNRHVSLLIDNEHKVTYASALLDRKIIFYWLYNDTYDIKYLDRTSNIGQLFGQPRYLKLTPKEYANIKKGHGKKVADKMKKERAEKPLMYKSHWTSTRNLILHLKKFKSVEVLDTPYGDFLPF